jgi:hypothetical protein
MENKAKKTVFKLPVDVDKFYEEEAKRKGIKPNAVKISVLVQYARENKLEY